MKKQIITRIIVVVALVAAALALLFPTLKSIKLGLDLQGGFEVLYQIESIDGKEKITSDVVKAIESVCNLLALIMPMKLVIS